MKLKDIVAVSGMPGLFKMIASRDNGIIIEDFDTGNRTFASVRKYQFTPLETVGIYTYKDVQDLTEIFETMRKSELPIPDANAPGTELHTFFRKIVKDYDEDRVYLGDIKKVIKWYGFLKERNLFDREDEEE
ncbi:MAG TPA: DUF5606 domain-containing protein [Saprospiraceae bacterium]|nr:DUF5606 domain-containing protein [Saprospiraceae bacterium]